MNIAKNNIFMIMYILFISNFPVVIWAVKMM